MQREGARHRAQGTRGKGVLDMYPMQRTALVRINEYAYRIPCVKEGEEIFLKTIIPSRKATNKYVRVER
jgi:hypothetical protein